MDMNSKVDYKAIEEVVRRAGMMMKEAHLSSDSVHHKEGAANFVTSYDVAIQRFLIEELHRIVPEAAFFGEEETEGNTREKELDGLCFLIDPIDGTTNFMFRYNYSCVSVGLAYAREMTAGFVYNPYVDEMYTAVRGETELILTEKSSVCRMPDLLTGLLLSDVRDTIIPIRMSCFVWYRRCSTAVLR